MTKDERKKIRKEYKEYFARRTSCREKDCVGYRRFCFNTDKYIIFVKNNPYYEAMYDTIIYSKRKHEIIRRYDNDQFGNAMKSVAIWLADLTTFAYSNEQRID